MAGASVAPAADGAGGDAMDALAFKRLYPEFFYQRFLDDDVRPDGRPLGRTRPTTIGCGVVETADASALVKVGRSTVLASVKLEVFVPSAATPDEGKVVTTVEMPPLCCAAARPGRTPDAAHCLAQQVDSVLCRAGVVDMKELGISLSQAAWCAYLDIYILDSDGSMLDACMLAALATLQQLRLPQVVVGKSGEVELQEGANNSTSKALTLKHKPLALTCGLYGERLVVDPTAEEEALLHGLVRIVVNEDGTVLALFKHGGTQPVDPRRLRLVHDLARTRHGEALALLDAAIAEAAA